MKYIGKRVEYLSFGNVKRTATIRKIEFHHELGKPIFIAESPFSHIVRLTKDEICRVI